MKFDNKTITIIIFILAGMLITISQSIITTGIVYLMGDFGVTSTIAQWTYSAYLLVVGVMIPLSAFISRRFKIKTVFISVISLFLIGSIISYFLNQLKF